MSNTATRYFNTKVHVSNQEERILAMLLSGLTFNDLYVMTKEDRVKVKGLPRDLTMTSLNQFSRKYGTSPDILQLARPNLAGNVKGYMADKEQLTEVGQRVEVSGLHVHRFQYGSLKEDRQDTNLRRSHSRIYISGLLFRLYAWTPS